MAPKPLKSYYSEDFRGYWPSNLKDLISRSCRFGSKRPSLEIGIGMVSLSVFFRVWGLVLA